MWFDNFITDKVNFYKENWELIYENLWIQLNSNWEIYIWWIDKLFEKWYYFIRKVNQFVEEKYIITKIDYQDHPRNKSFRMTIMEIERIWDEKKENIWNINIENLHNSGNLAFENNWTQSNQNINNQIDEIIKLLDKKDIKQKE